MAYLVVFKEEALRLKQIFENFVGYLCSGFLIKSLKIEGT